jgi:hypothetical protein
MVVGSRGQKPILLIAARAVPLLGLSRQKE